MGLLTRIRRHAAVSGGDFGAMFKDIEIPPLPAVATGLLREFDAPEPSIERLTRIVSADVEVTARILRTVNSSLYGLPTPVKGLRQAIAMMGLQNLYSLALSYAVKDALPAPESDIFDRRAFWTDSLLRALTARELASCLDVGEPDEAFTAMLLADVAIPVLLSSWRRYYEPVMQRWAASTGRLSTFEREEFDWDHAMAGAWILESWAFPEELVTLVEVHDRSVEEIRRLDLDGTVALPLVLAAQMPSSLRYRREQVSAFIDDVVTCEGMSLPRLETILSAVEAAFGEIHDVFDLAGDEQPVTVFQLREEVADMIAETSP